MKKILLAAALLLGTLLAPLANASFTVNQASGNLTGTANITLSISIPAGHTVVVFAYGQGGGSTLGTVTDSGGDTYSYGTITNAFTNYTAGTAWALAIPSSITSVTFTPPGTAGASGIFVWDVTATGTISVASTNANQYAFNSVPTTDATNSGALTTSSIDGLLLAVAYDQSSNAVAAGTGYTSDGTFNVGSGRGEHKAVTTGATPTFTAAGTNDLIFAAGVALQVSAPVVINGALISNGHPVKSGSAVLYQ